jgi:hypothetical protein
LTVPQHGKTGENYGLNRDPDARFNESVISIAAAIKPRKLARPFLKWAGGKTRLVPPIQALRPTRVRRFLEPFVGSGALALNSSFADNLIADANRDLREADECHALSVRRRISCNAAKRADARELLVVFRPVKTRKAI